jgi:hypothetical protein
MRSPPMHPSSTGSPPCSPNSPWPSDRTLRGGQPCRRSDNATAPDRFVILLHLVAAARRRCHERGDGRGEGRLAGDAAQTLTRDQANAGEGCSGSCSEARIREREDCPNTKRCCSQETGSDRVDGTGVWWGSVGEKLITVGQQMGNTAVKTSQR